MTEVYAKIKGSASTMEPSTPASAPVGSIFVDVTNSNALSFKSTGGTVITVGAVSSSDIMSKLKKNMSGFEILINTPVALKPDGSIAAADNDGLNVQVVIGISQETIAHDAYGRVMLNGPNATGAVADLGFVPGNAILLSSVPGQLTNTTVGIDPVTMTVMKVGIADCASGVCSATATDLIMEAEVISRPSGV